VIVSLRAFVFPHLRYCVSVPYTCRGKVISRLFRGPSCDFPLRDHRSRDLFGHCAPKQGNAHARLGE
jgi:hypothetical protein